MLELGKNVPSRRQGQVGFAAGQVTLNYQGPGKSLSNKIIITKTSKQLSWEAGIEVFSLSMVDLKLTPSVYGTKGAAKLTAPNFVQVS